MGDVGGVDIAPYAPRSILETLPCQLPKSQFEAAGDFEAVVSSIVNCLGNLQITDLSADSIWRDLFAFTGTTRTFYAPESIVSAWTATCSQRRVSDFAVIEGSTIPIRLGGDIGWLNVGFTFSCQSAPIAQCRGILSLVLDSDGQWKIWLLRTILEKLEGCNDVDQLAPVRQSSSSDEAQNETEFNASNHFDCVVVGCGQAGLSAGGRLQALGISYVILDKHEKIGDNWMTRYDSARLHTSREYGHLPFDRTFPLPYQEFLTKYDLARGYKDWVEKFGIDKHIWFSSTLHSGTWNEEQRRYTLEVRQPDGVNRIACRYVIMATGGGGQIPIMPTYPGREVFQGTVLHSAEYKSATGWRGKAGIVVGTANTAHDVAEDMVEADMSAITMVQRTRTYVLPYEYFKTISDRSYNADVPTVDADRDQYSMPHVLGRLMSRRALHAAASQEPERFDALERAGFRVERYGDIMWHILVKLGGHYMDVGCSDKIARGMVSRASSTFAQTPIHCRPGLYRQHAFDWFLTLARPRRGE